MLKAVGVLLVSLFAVSVAGLACYDAKAPLPPCGADPNCPDFTVVEPDDSPDAASSLCGKACVGLRKAGCSDGKPTSDGVSCYRACLKASQLRTLPLSCWERAASVEAAKACGGVRCLP